MEQNVREHVEFALAGTPAPVGAEHLGVVLDRLGPPERWLPENEQSAWKRAMERMRSGPEDWRLAYLSFALFFLMIVLFPIGGFLLLIPGFILSRAYVSLVEEKGEPIGARKWLVLPSIAMALFLFAIAALVGPAAGVMGWGLEEGGLQWMAGSAPDTQLKIGFGLTAVGVWWLIVPIILAMLHRPLQRLFRPLLDGLRRKHLFVVALLGLVLAGAGAAVLYR